MDGLSSAATVLQVIQVAAQVIAALNQYVLSVKEAESSRRRLVKHITLVVDAATAVKAVLDRSSTSVDIHDNTLIKQWFDDNGPLSQCKKVLEDLLNWLEASAKARMKWTQRLKWPLKEKKILAAIQAFEKLRPYFQLVLEVDIL